MTTLDGRINAFLSGVNKTRGPRERETRANAQRLFREYFEKRRLDLGHIPKVKEFLPVQPVMIIEDMLEADYLEPKVIPSEGFEGIITGEREEIIGLTDRGKNRIVVAGKFNPESKRFTAAHEIGHWLLHCDVIFFRERHTRRSLVEREADVFAAELLMPTFHLVKTFFNRFGGPVDGTQPKEELAFWLSAGSKKNFDSFDFVRWRRRDRSRLIAQISSFRMRYFDSLAKRYGVSTTAMAIQLEDLGLVK